MIMEQTVEEAANKMCEAWGMEDNHGYSVKDTFKVGFVQGAKWQKTQSPWISVEERLPDEGQRVLVGFFYRYKYFDREAESRKYVDTLTYENGMWTTDSDISYLGENVKKGDIKVVCWMPLPSFDEILKANRDVLDRIKEKGD